MQSQIFLVSLALMFLLALVFVRGVVAPGAPLEATRVNRQRSWLLWGLVMIGLVLSVASLRSWPHRAAGAEVLVVNVSGGQWWWETDTTEIPLGQEVEFRVTTEDVNHGLGIYTDDMTLITQVQVMPGYTNTLVHTFEQPGRFHLLCMEYCGVAHHDMVNEFQVVEVQ
ncbi:cupredoxin domain-containing protein [Tritonibacter horizontis]|uniref:Cytochrome c oxidase subunit 2 n=1 Tax=Tritonibacter horizontis TaxID=1768241 RepID=A0A132BYV1_9RHOB|nr:cytochrome C oxidase subunit I [Tritonibacter horizontis]KUP93396.1 cytochrome c oxidase subunit 2 [Tritonibacter horizontis]